MNKSEELAKLLGLKGKITCEKHCVGSKGVDKNGKSMCLKCSKSGLIYPDFTKPSNFVKLKEISNPKYVEEFLQFLTHIIKTNQLSDAEEFKQQAQQTEWEY